MSDKLRELVKRMRETSEYWDTGWVVSGWCDELEALLPTEPVARSHRWNAEGEECLDCGDRDWMGDPICRPTTYYIPGRNGDLPCSKEVAMAWDEREDEFRHITDPDTLVSPSDAVTPDGSVTPMTTPTEPVAVAYVSQGALIALETCRNDDHNGCVDVWMRPTELANVPLYTTPTEPAPDREDAERLDFIAAHRVAVYPELDGPWYADTYDEGGEVLRSHEGATPRAAIDFAMGKNAARQEQA